MSLTLYLYDYQISTANEEPKPDERIYMITNSMVLAVISTFFIVLLILLFVRRNH